MPDDPSLSPESPNPWLSGRCTARTKRGPCRAYPVRGATVCVTHGGAAPQVRNAASRRLIEAEIRELFGKALPESVPVDNPLAAYAEFAGRVMAWMQLMDSLLGDLRTVGYEGKAGEQIRAEVLLYERAMDRANTVLSSYARLNIDDRLASITEQQAKVVIGAIEAVISHLGVSGPAAAEARKVAAAHLRLVGGEA